MRTMLESQVGLGTFPFSSVFTEVSQDTARAIVRDFLDSGGSYIETAPSYPRAAVDLGVLLREHDRSQFTLGTKCVRYPAADGSMEIVGDAPSIRRQCQGELERLGVDYLDLLQAHTLPDEISAVEVVSALNDLKREGLVRYVGVSNVGPDKLRECLKAGSVDFLQNRYSVIHRPDLDEITQICAQNSVVINPYQVIERGQLLPHGTDVWRPEDLRRAKPEYSGRSASIVKDWSADVLVGIASTFGLTPESLCIGWALSQPQMVLPVVGTTSVEQIRRNLAVKPLTPNALAAVDEAYKDLEDRIRKEFHMSVVQYRELG